MVKFSSWHIIECDEGLDFGARCIGTSSPNNPYALNWFGHKRVVETLSPI